MHMPARADIDINLSYKGWFDVNATANFSKRVTLRMRISYYLMRGRAKS